MNLGQRQELLARLLPRLIDAMFAAGYAVRLGEAHRPPETAAAYAKAGKGITNSLHCDKLAVDLHLFRDGAYLSSGAEHRPFGELWESLDPMCRWGGRFNDSNHYSVTWQGRK